MAPNPRRTPKTGGHTSGSAAAGLTHGRVGSSTNLKLLKKLEDRYGMVRTKSLLEGVVRETSFYVRAISQAADAVELQMMRERNAVSLAVLKAEIFRDSLSSDEVKAIIDRSRPTVNRMAKDGELLGVPDGRVLRFPRWQFDPESETGLVAGLREVLDVMDASPLQQAAWFIRQNRRLRNRTPLDVLRAGDVASVVDEAKSLSPP